MCAYTDLPVAVCAGDLREQVGYGEAGAGMNGSALDIRPAVTIFFSGDEALTEQRAAAEPIALTNSAEGDSVLFIT